MREFCNRYYRLLAVAILAIAAFNLGLRLNSERVEEWDESLYGLSAWEMVQSGDWIATTRLGAIDYYNTKPPLNVWLIAASFKTFGASLLSLRLPSALSAWATVVVLLIWGGRHFGREVGLASSLVLATCYGFLYVHSGKSADTDAMFTLLILLTVVTVHAAELRPWRLIWLGPITAATFLLRGMAVAMPLLIVLIVQFARGRSDLRRFRALGLAALLCAIPIVAWSIARWRFDRWAFFEKLFFYDFVERTGNVIEGHPGGLLYYLNMLQRYQYDWLLAALAAILLFPLPWRRMPPALAGLRHPGNRLRLVLAAWAFATLAVPTVIRTKLPWYLNPFYPLFALGVAWVIVRGLTLDRGHVRRVALACTVVLAVVIAEAKLVWTSYYRRDPSLFVQGLLFAESRQLRGHVVCRSRWNNAEIFVLDALIHAERRICRDASEFARDSRRGDYFVTTPDVSVDGLVLVRADARNALYRRDD